MKIIKKGINLQYSKIIRRGIAICHCCPFVYYIYIYFYFTQHKHPNLLLLIMRNCHLTWPIR